MGPDDEETESEHGMTELSKADAFLLDRIRAGESEGWRQLVERYQGRLTAFARARLGSAADADDLVQETFLSFLKGLNRFAGRASLETFLFTILRNRIIDHHRGRRVSACILQESIGSDSSAPVALPLQQAPAADLTASTYARRDEAHESLRDALAEALGALVAGYRDALNFRDLMVVELLFYCQLRNKDIAPLVSLDEKQIALIKHRTIKRIRQAIADSPPADGEFSFPDSLLTEVWEDLRPSCPKRNTLGAYLLGTLDRPWRQYVAFHVEQLGCRFCQANLEDLKLQTTDDRAGRPLRQRIMQSTVGFLRKG